MLKYLATVRVNNQSVKTLVFADSSIHARLLLQYQFGINSIVNYPVATNEASSNHKTLDEVAKTIKPLTPQQARINSLKQQKDNATKALKTEKDRQKISKAQQQIQSVVANRY